MNNIHDEAAYRRFAENLPSALKGKNIKHVNLNGLKKHAIRHSVKTTFGSYGWRSMISSRIGPKTVYLGSPSIRQQVTTPLMNGLIKNSPDELHKILQLVQELPMVRLTRRMGDNQEYNPRCSLYMSVTDPRFNRLAYMWGNTMHNPESRKPGPEFTMIHIPEEHQIRQQVLVMPEHHINIALGTDYMGEDKKGFLRQAMWYADEHGMLGLHAGTKLVTARDSRDGRLKKYGVFLFGLSATGKSTWSCHRLGLDEKSGEGTQVLQDDIVFLKPDGSAYGSEANFFVKTDVDPELQEALHWSLTDKTALYENVMINARGVPLFLDERLCANGRAVVRKDKMRVRMGRKLVSIEAKGIDMPSLEELDGIVFAFITRRNTFMSFSQELTAEQAVLAYLWGESSHSYASQPAKAGESVRTVGTDPFIVGSRARKVNRFREIIMSLSSRFPGKVRFFQYNTGGVGEIINVEDTPEGKKKTLVRKVTRVPIPVMAAIQRGDLRGANRYETGRLGTKAISHVEGYDLHQYDPARLYDQSQIDKYISELVSGRRDFTNQIIEEGLDREIIKWAEETFSTIGGESTTPQLVKTPVNAVKLEKEPLPVLSENGSKSLYRPPRSLGWKL